MSREQVYLGLQKWNPGGYIYSVDWLTVNRLEDWWMILKCYPLAAVCLIFICLVPIFYKIKNK